MGWEQRIHRPAECCGGKDSLGIISSWKGKESLRIFGYLVSLEQSILNERFLKLNLFPSKNHRVLALLTEHFMSGEGKQLGWRDEGSVLGVRTEEVIDQR